MSAKVEADAKRPTLSVSDDKKHVLSGESVKLFAEAAGYAELTDEAASLLAQDVTYRLKEVTQNSCQFMKHSRRKKLMTTDFNKALKNSDVEPVYGYGSSEPMVFQQVKEEDIHFVEDVNVNITNLSQKPFVHQRSALPQLKVQWLAVEGIQKNLSTATSNKPTDIKPDNTLSEDLLTYYDGITKALLGNDEELTKIALNDLRTNNRIGPLLPHLCSFVANGVKTVNYDISQLTKLLYTVHSLVRNSSLYLLPHPYLTLLVQAVTYCLVEPVSASISPLNDHWVLRDYAAFLLAFITRECETPTNKLYSQNILSLQTILHDDNRQLCSHYGAIRGLTMLGYKAVEDVIFSYLETYMPTLQNALADVSYGTMQIKMDANSVYGALLLAAEVLLKGCHGDTEDKNDLKETSSSSHHKVSQLNKTYLDLYAFFGDSLTTRLPKENVRYRPPVAKTSDLCLSDNDARRTGEELLEQFLQDPAESERTRDEEDIEVDEKSESKSYRSGNSEDLAYNSNVAVTVKSSVNDPEKGIKLTISMKRPSSAGGKHKKRKTGHKYSMKDSAEFDLPMITRKNIEIVGKSFKNKPVQLKCLNQFTQGCEKLGKFRQLSFSKSIIGKLKHSQGKQVKGARNSFQSCPSLLNWM